ncbi:MAG: polysaccharide lyase beta-sandwich domain-containing protein [Lachnospiraceae bacterium]|nr:polysaccharide lyase beta-sandwich domain-containing protein [Lachnospiraceae bacterium]
MKKQSKRIKNSVSNLFLFCAAILLVGILGYALIDNGRIEVGGRIHSDMQLNAQDISGAMVYDQAIFGENFGEDDLHLRVRLHEFLRIDGGDEDGHGVAGAVLEDTSTWPIFTINGNFGTNNSFIRANVPGSPGAVQVGSQGNVRFAFGDAALVGTAASNTGSRGSKYFLPTHNQLVGTNPLTSAEVSYISNNHPRSYFANPIAHLFSNTTGAAVEPRAFVLNPLDTVEPRTYGVVTGNNDFGIADGSHNQFSATATFTCTLMYHDRETSDLRIVTDITHTARRTKSPTHNGIMTLDQWVAARLPQGDFWILDTETGWFYWNGTLPAESATSLLINAVSVSPSSGQHWAYAIHVNADWWLEGYAPYGVPDIILQGAGTEPTLEFELGTSEQDRVIVYVGEYRRIREVGTPMTWPARNAFTLASLFSVDETIAAVHRDGFVEGLQPGLTVIRAERGADFGLIFVEVRPARNDEFDVLRRNYFNFLLPNVDINSPDGQARRNALQNSATNSRNSMNRSFVPGVAGLTWSVGENNVFATNARAPFSQMNNLARGFALPGSIHYLCPDMFDSIEAGMRWNLDNIFRGPVGDQNNWIPVYNMLNDLYPRTGPNATPESIAMNNFLRQSPPIRSGNWIHWGQFIPLDAVQTLTLMYEFGLCNELIQAYSRRIMITAPHAQYGTGVSRGNPNHQSRRTHFTLMTGVFRRDADRVNLAASQFLMGEVFRVSSGLLPITNPITVGSGLIPGSHGSGYFWDGSNIGHNHYASAWTYGNATRACTARFLATIYGGATMNGQLLAYDEALMEQRMQMLIDSTLPVVWRGGILPSHLTQDMTAVSGRGTGRIHEMTGMVLGFHVGEENRRIFEEHLASWGVHNPALLGGAGFATIVVRDAVNHPDIVPREQTGIFARNFESRMIYRDENFLFEVAYNNFNANTRPFSVGAAQNRMGVYMGEGMHYLMLHNDQFQFHDNYFASVEFQRLPGTTVAFRNEGMLPWVGANADRNPNHTMGGTAVLRDDDGAFATTTFRQNFSGNSTPRRDCDLRANKSWFMVDGRIYAMGSGITGTRANREVATTLDNRRIPTGFVQSFVFNGQAAGALSSRGTPATNSWAHLSYAGTAPSGGTAQLGYFIPAGQNIHIGTQRTSGRWSDSDAGASTAVHSNLFANVRIGHGVTPTNRRYEYVLLPNYTQAQVQAFHARQASSDPAYIAVANTNTLHAIYFHDRNMLMINNFANAPAIVTSPRTGISYTISTAGSVIIREHTDGTVNISIHDPTGVNNNISVIMNRVVTRLSGDGNMAVTPSGGNTVVQASQLTSFLGRRFATWDVLVRKE